MRGEPTGRASVELADSVEVLQARIAPSCLSCREFSDPLREREEPEDTLVSKIQQQDVELSYHHDLEGSQDWVI